MDADAGPLPPPALRGGGAGVLRSRRGRLALAGGAVVALLTLAGCTGAGSPQGLPEGAGGAVKRTTLATAPPMQPDDVVDLTIYLRSGQGAAAHLEPVVREVPVTDDLPRRALELLVAGPVEADGMLEPVLPPTTDVRALDVEGGVARVDLSGAVLRDAEEVGSTPVHEVLALGALVNTLTEFPSIERVVVTVDGQLDADVRAFWGSWGLPAVLVRDESLVGERQGGGSSVADIVRFSADAQEAGAPGGAAVRVTGIRVRDRLTHTRFVVELADATDPDAPPRIPEVRARRTDDDIVLLLGNVADLGEGAADTADATALEVDPAHFTAARAEHDARAGSLRLVLSPTSERPYWLHTLADPTRIILDVKK